MSTLSPRSRLVGFDPQHQRLVALARDTATVHHAMVALRDEEFARILTFRWHQLVAPAYTTADLPDLDALATQAQEDIAIITAMVQKGQDVGLPERVVNELLIGQVHTYLG